MGDFAVDTRVAGDSGRYRAQISEDWKIWGPNGGYLAAIALRAVGREAAIPRPTSFAGHFVSVARFDEVELEVTPIRVGRRAESFRVSMTQGGKPVLEALVRTASEGPGLEHDITKMPQVPGPEGLKSAQQIAEERGFPKRGGFPFWQNLESRILDPDQFGKNVATPPLHREWYRFRPRPTFNDPWTDAARALVLIDTLSWPAAAKPHKPDPPFTAPNLDVTAWFHTSASDEEWLLADSWSPVASRGLMGTLANVWSASGKLVATGGAQLFCVPNPPA